MNRKKVLQLLGIGFLGAPVPTFANDTLAKHISFQADFLPAWKRSEEYTIALFEQMPEDKLDFRYTPESFTFRTQFVHCITFTAMQICARLSIKNPYMHGIAWDKLSRAELASEIRGFYAWVARVLGSTSPNKLKELTDFSGDSISVTRLFYAMENHIIHHRGQALCYLRLNGITPLGYVGW